MNLKTKAAIKQQALAELPNECCGFIVSKNGREKLFPCRNTHPEPRKFFRIDPEQWLEARKDGFKPLSVYHSHPHTPAIPSAVDRAVAEETLLPWHIYSVSDDAWTFYQPNGYQTPLLGREFVYSVFDCYTLLRDFYRQELGIEFPDAGPYPDEWWHKGMSMYVDLYKDWGFDEIRDEGLQKYDCFLIQVASDVPNHAAVWLGNDLIIHHVQGRLSNQQPYGGMWMKHTAKTLRHRKLR